MSLLSPPSPPLPSAEELATTNKLHVRDHKPWVHYTTYAGVLCMLAYIPIMRIVGEPNLDSQYVYFAAATLLFLFVLVAIVYFAENHWIFTREGIRTWSFNEHSADYIWANSRTDFFVLSKDEGRKATVALVTETGFYKVLTPLSWTSETIGEAERDAVAGCSQIWDWAVARGFTQETGQYRTLKPLIKSDQEHYAELQAERDRQECEYSLHNRAK